MQIHELNTFSGTLGQGDFFATDNGNDTSRVSAQALIDQAVGLITDLMYYGTCATAASTATKVVDCSDFELKTGAVIAIKFTNAQTSTSSVYLNVNNTGAKQVYGIARSTTSNSRVDGAWEANEVKIFAYDGTYWRIVGQNIISSAELSALETALGISGQDIMRLFNILNNIVTRLKSAESSIATLEIESGTTTAGSVTWKYKKYRDGTLEMWGTGSTSLAISTASGAIFSTASEYDVAMPTFVASTDFLSGEISGGGWVDVTTFNVPPKVKFYAPTSFASANRVLKYYFRGTWS